MIFSPSYSAEMIFAETYSVEFGTPNFFRLFSPSYSAEMIFAETYSAEKSGLSRFSPKTGHICTHAKLILPRPREQGKSVKSGAQTLPVSNVNQSTYKVTITSPVSPCTKYRLTDPGSRENETGTGPIPSLPCILQQAPVPCSNYTSNGLRRPDMHPPAFKS